MSLPKSPTSPPPIFTPHDLTILWRKSQAYAHLGFGIWITALIASSWNIGVYPILITAAIYVGVYVVYLLLFPLLSRRTLWPVLPELDQLSHGTHITEKQAEKVIIFLLNLPQKAVLVNLKTTLFAFIVGSMIWIFHVIPELSTKVPIAMFQTFILGVVISITEAYYNYAFAQEKTYASAKALISLYPDLARKSFKTNGPSIQTKLILSIRGFSVTAQISLLLFLATYLATPTHDQTSINQIIITLFLVMILGFVNLAFLTPKIARTFTQPLKDLSDWSSSVAQGNLDSTITSRTTDEISDVIVRSNQMVYSLSQDRKNLEEERNKLTAVVEGIVDGIISIDTSNHITFANKQIHQIFGVADQSLIGEDPGKHISIFDSANKDITYRIFSKTNEQIKRAELRLVDAHNTSKFVNIICTPIATHHDNASYVVAIHDVSKEQELEQMKVDFVSMAAHELRTPLTSVTGYLATLQEEMGYFNDDHKLFVNRGLESAQQLMDLVDDLLAISRIERGVLKLIITPIDWQQLLEQSIKDTAALASRKEITVTVKDPPIPLPKVEADESRIKEVLHNLISNAIKYSPAKTTITVSAEREENAIVTHVSDEGIGIPQNALPRLFSKFYRVSASTGENAHTGTGLGLYISKAMIDMHHGKIWVDSKISKGSTFSFSLPIKSPVTQIY